MTYFMDYLYVKCGGGGIRTHEGLFTDPQV